MIITTFKKSIMHKNKHIPPEQLHRSQDSISQIRPVAHNKGIIYIHSTTPCLQNINIHRRAPKVNKTSLHQTALVEPCSEQRRDI